MQDEDSRKKYRSEQMSNGPTRNHRREARREQNAANRLRFFGPAIKAAQKNRGY